MYSNSVKVFIAGKVPSNELRLLQDIKSVSVYRILDVNDGEQPKVVKETGETAAEKPEIVNAIPSGIVLIVQGSGVSEEVENFVKLWDDAGIDRPDLIELTPETEGASKIIGCLVDQMQNEIRSACVRNVDVRGQMAFLREEVEQANIQLRQLNGVVVARDGGAHTLLRSATATVGFISLKAGEVMLQKLPLSVHAWSLGALGIFVSAVKPTIARVRLIAAEDDAVVCEWTLSIDAGASWQMMRLSQRIPNRYQLIHVEVKMMDEDAATLELGIAKSLSPDEEISIEGAKAHHTLVTQLWGGGRVGDGELHASAYAANHVFDVVAGACMEDAPLAWIADAEPLSTITKPPKWFGQSTDSLLVHPSVNVVAAAGINLKHEKVFDGIAIDFIVPDIEGKIVQFCLAAIDHDMPMPSVQELTNFAEENGRARMNEAVTTTNWISTLPGGLMKSIPLLFDNPKNNIKLVLMTRVNGKTAGNCSSYFKKLRYIYKTRKYNG